MRGKNKNIVPLVLAGLTTATGLVTTVNQQQQTFVQADEVTISSVAGAELKLTGGFEDTYSLGSPITMPVVEVAGLDSYDLVYTITRGTKTMKTITIASTNAVAGKIDPALLLDEDEDGVKDGAYKPSYTGAYKVTIEAKKDGVVASKIEGLTIMVEKADAVIKLPVNSKYVIPAKIAKGQKGFKIPAPSVEVVDIEGNEVENPTGDLTVTLITPAGEVSFDESDKITTDAENPYYAVSEDDLDTEGTCQIRYEYKEGNVVVSRLESNFQIVDDLDISENLYLKLQSSIPSTGNVKTNISVPKVTVLDSSTATDGINAHVTITYAKLNDDGSKGTAKEIDYTNYTFCPEEEGNYVLSYSADIELFGSATTTPYNPSTIIKVKDNKEPSVRPTYDYTVAVNATSGKYEIKTVNGEVVEDGTKLSDVLANRKCDIPSVVIAGKKFNLPAIWGEDNFYNWENIEFTREIVGSTIPKRTYKSVLASEGVDAQYPANTAIEVDALEAGNYEIRYIAKDNNGSGKAITATYSLVVKDSADENEDDIVDSIEDAKTDVKLSIGISSITNKEKLTFNKPTATDSYDSSVDIVTGYELYTVKPSEGVAGEKVTDTSFFKLTKTNDAGKYEIDIAKILEDYPSAKYIRVMATGIVDDYRANRETVVDKYISLIDTTTDSVAASFAIKGIDMEDSAIDGNYAKAWNTAIFNIATNKDKAVKQNGETSVVVDSINESGYAVIGGSTVTIDGGTELLAAFDQGKESLEIPAITFTDADENLRVRLSITDSRGNLVSKTSYETVEKSRSSDTDPWTYEISGASFKMSSAGVYTITFRAEDVAGNVTVRSFGVRVNDKTAPTIVIENEDKFGGDVEIGDFFEVPAGNLIKNGTVQQDREVTWQVSGGEYVKTSTGFYPLETGTYYVKYYGTDSSGNPQLLQDDSLFYINAKDTTAPVFNDDSTITINPTMAWNPEEDPSSSVDKMEIKIPVVYATDPIKNDAIDVTCTVTGPDGSSVKLKGYEDTDDFATFTATKQGKYTIKYEAVDGANNKVTMTKEIALGDCVAPTLEWKNNYAVPTTVKLGEELELKLGDDYFSLNDNVSEATYLADNMTIKLVKPDGTTELKNNGLNKKNYKWTLTETGTYTLNIIVKDEAGMSNTYKYTIEVPAEEAENKTVSPVVGTVLIIVSVVILAGVVVYFVVSSKKKASVKTSRSRKKD